MENRRLLLSYLNGNKTTSQYRLKQLCVDAFDDELYQLFITRYLSSTNEGKIELCRTLLGMDFNNSHYSTPADQALSRKNYTALISKLETLVEGNCASIDNAIHKSFIEQLKRLISEPSDSDKE